MIIRKAEPKDTARIAELARTLARHVDDPDPGDRSEELAALGLGDDPWFACLLAEENGEVQGAAIYSRIYEAHTASKFVWLSDLVVADDARGTGLGRQLLEALKKEAARLGCKAIRFEIWKQNEMARLFYEKIGAQKATDTDLLYISSN